jgi:solute carrier family 35 protein E1
VANSAKRVVILFAAVLVLGETVSARKLAGCAVAIGGVTLYSLAKAVASKKSKASKKPKKTLVEIKVVEGTEQAGTWQP